MRSIKHELKGENMDNEELKLFERTVNSIKSVQDVVILMSSRLIKLENRVIELEERIKVFENGNV